MSGCGIFLRSIKPEDSGELMQKIPFAVRVAILIVAMLLSYIGLVPLLVVVLDLNRFWATSILTGWTLLAMLTASSLGVFNRAPEE